MIVALKRAALQNKKSFILWSSVFIFFAIIGASLPLAVDDYRYAITSTAGDFYMNIFHAANERFFTSLLSLLVIHRWTRFITYAIFSALFLYLITALLKRCLKIEITPTIVILSQVLIMTPGTNILMNTYGWYSGFATYIVGTGLIFYALYLLFAGPEKRSARYIILNSVIIFIWSWTYETAPISLVLIFIFGVIKYKKTPAFKTQLVFLAVSLVHFIFAFVFQYVFPGAVPSENVRQLNMFDFWFEINNCLFYFFKDYLIFNVSLMSAASAFVVYYFLKLNRSKLNSSKHNLSRIAKCCIGLLGAAYPLWCIYYTLDQRFFNPPVNQLTWPPLLLVGLAILFLVAYFYICLKEYQKKGNPALILYILSLFASLILIPTKSYTGLPYFVPARAFFAGFALMALSLLFLVFDSKIIFQFAVFRKLIVSFASLLMAFALAAYIFTGYQSVMRNRYVRDHVAARTLEIELPRFTFEKFLVKNDNIYYSLPLPIYQRYSALKEYPYNNPSANIFRAYHHIPGDTHFVIQKL
ncbi:MAG: hypothetical protein LBB10_03620 [Bifidobacteriaceae bacterium]|nr:hypothetical protein [Bifidobacteriaceae bacterium]